MISRKLQFSTIDQVQKFVDGVRKISCDVDARHGNYIVDAKSLLGILSLSLGKEITIVVHSDDDEAAKALDALCDEILNL